MCFESANQSRTAKASAALALDTLMSDASFIISNNVVARMRNTSHPSKAHGMKCLVLLGNLCGQTLESSLATDACYIPVRPRIFL